MNNNEDIILLGLKAKDETEDFINRHLENPAKGWPKLCLNTCSSLNEYKKHKLKKKVYNSTLF